ncbi:MAG: hypothetical protein ABWZ56_08975 [Flavobacterium sp.]
MKRITPLIFLLFFSISISMHSNVSSLEKNALIKLYKSTNGNQWKIKWNLNAPISSWYGVKLQNDKVIALDLSDNNLVGKLPDEITNLVNLQQLNFFKNELSGNIPASIGTLKIVTIIEFSIQ